MIDALSSKVAHSIKQANPDHPASFNVLKFAVAGVINVVGTIIIALVAALFLGHVWPTVLALASFAMLRSVSGGYHLNSSSLCMLITAAAANIIPYIVLPQPAILTMTLVSMLLAFLYAPTNIEKSSRIPSRYYPVLKAVAVLLVSTNLFIHSSVIAICFLLQCLLLVKVSWKGR